MLPILSTPAAVSERGISLVRPVVAALWSRITKKKRTRRSVPMKTWNETGRIREEDHGMLDEEQVAQCERADVAEPLRAPIPTRMISNGEYMPAPQTDQQRRVEARVAELAEEASNRLGISRRKFLHSSGGMAA